MRDAIAEDFDRYLTLASNAGFEMSGHTLPAFGTVATQCYCNDIRQVIAAKAGFFADHDYEWATRVENYSHPLEAQLQFGLLLIISDISPQHPDYARLGDICVRTLPSRHINTEALIRSGNKYIVVATSMIRLMQAWGIASSHLCKLGSTTSLEDVSLICRADHLGGRRMERAVRTQWCQLPTRLDYLIDTCVAYRLGQVPERSFALTQQEIDDGLARAVLLLFVGEMFFVCHELIHLLKHGEAHAGRTAAEEIEADRMAVSLFFIFQSRITSWHPGDESSLYQHPVVLSAIFSGPAIFFSVMHTLLLIERMTMASASEQNSVMLELVTNEFNLNRTRMLRLQEALRAFGFGPLVGMYADALQELDVLGVACRMRIAERWQLPAEVSLERNLFRGFR